MEEYALAEEPVSLNTKCKHAVINVDDEVGKAWVSDLSNAIAVSLSPLTDYQQSVWASDVAYAETSVFSCLLSMVVGDKGSFVPLIGQFNASNVLLLW